MMNIEIYDTNNIQYCPAVRNLKFVKSFIGGEDIGLDFVLDRAVRRDWPDIGYSYDTILREGLKRIFRGTMRQISQDRETITLGSFGYWIYLDDFCYDDELTAAGDLETLAAAVITKAIAMGGPISASTDLIDNVTLDLSTLYFDKKDKCWDVMKEAADFGDQNNELVGWGIESGGDRLYVKQPDRESVRYVIHPADAKRLLRKGDTTRNFATEGWGRYGPERAYTDKYYAHLTNAGMIANTTSTGDDLASAVFNVRRDAVIECGDVLLATAIEIVEQSLIESAHPQMSSAFDIFYPVKDLHMGGAKIAPYEMEMGYITQIPYFRAVEAEGAAGVDLREWDTTFLLIGMQYDDESKTTTLYPEDAIEDLSRVLAYTQMLARGEQ